MLWTREEKEIAIVTHSGFLFHALSAVGNDCHPLIKKEISSTCQDQIPRQLIIQGRFLPASMPLAMLWMRRTEERHPQFLICRDNELPIH
ncbi:hypothetical protein ACSBR2_011352 [Camellia fascicularis]